MTVTRAELDALRARLSKPAPQMQLTPDGATMHHVHSELDEQQHKKLRAGEKSLSTMQKKLRSDLEKIRAQGHNRAQFNGLSHTDACNLRL